jgi:hypothetical protein
MNDCYCPFVKNLVQPLNQLVDPTAPRNAPDVKNASAYSPVKSAPVKAGEPASGEKSGLDKLKGDFSLISAALV